MSISWVIRERERAREEVIREVMEYVMKLRARWGKLTAILYGSYARGDFNLWSDVDVILITEHFRGREFITRCVELIDAPPRLEPICWTPEEARKAMKKPWWIEALKNSIVLIDDYGLMGSGP
ncbi:nucleotidyltransferase domain-containing protein [Vulcanisaeta thermophila]|uniref:nucleotidyltransferase domain-containing protein n=1 Tax=Vulcanisaeta thermophila TaxID=867917 RepID=UPI0008537D5E|nr:nucleotidyltransferase domain-containing protein [Vulcanisaeta thermophila]